MYVANFIQKESTYYECKCNSDVIHVMGESILWRESCTWSYVRGINVMNRAAHGVIGHEFFFGSNINVYSLNHGTLSYTLQEVSTTITQIGSK